MQAITSEMRAQWKLTVPLALSQLAQQLMGFVDTAMLGRYDRSALAGSGIGNSLVFTITVVGLGAVLGLDTLIPQALGAGEEQRARRLLRQGLRVAWLVGIPLTIITALTPLLLPLANVEAVIADEATTYVYWRLPAIVPFLLFIAFRSFLQARGLTRPIVLAMVIGNLVNVVADVALIFGIESIGLPALGIAGAGAATSIVTVATMVVLGWSARSSNIAETTMDVAVDESKMSDRALRRSILRLGLPIGLQLGAEVGVFALTAVLAGRLGELPASAHQVALTLASLTFSIAIGIGAATSVRVGRAIGRGDPAATRAAGASGFIFGAIFMSVTGLVFLLAAEPLTQIFTDDRAVIDAAVPLLHIAAVFQLSDGAQAIGAGALRGAGDTHAPLVGNLIGHYVVGLPIMIYLAFGADMGARGLWWGLSAGLTGTALALVLRFFAIAKSRIQRA